MLSHITLGTDDWSKVRPFWMAIMATLEVPVFMESDEGIAFGAKADPKLFIGPAYNGETATSGNGTHVAFLAQSRAIVDAFYVAAMENGGTDEGQPGLRQHYHPNYYGAYVRDPNGNKLQAVCHSSES